MWRIRHLEDIKVLITELKEWRTIIPVISLMQSNWNLLLSQSGALSYFLIVKVHIEIDWEFQMCYKLLLKQYKLQLWWSLSGKVAREGLEWGEVLTDVPRCQCTPC